MTFVAMVSGDQLLGFFVTLLTSQNGRLDLLVLRTLWQPEHRRDYRER